MATHVLFRLVWEIIAFLNYYFFTDLSHWNIFYFVCVYIMIECPSRVNLIGWIKSQNWSLHGVVWITPANSLNQTT